MIKLVGGLSDNFTGLLTLSAIHFHWSSLYYICRLRVNIMLCHHLSVFSLCASTLSPVQCHSFSSVLLCATIGRLQDCICIIRLIFARDEVSHKDRSVSGSSYLRSEKRRNFAFKRLAYI